MEAAAAVEAAAAEAAKEAAAAAIAARRRPPSSRRAAERHCAALRCSARVRGVDVDVVLGEPHRAGRKPVQRPPANATYYRTASNIARRTWVGVGEGSRPP